MLERAEQLGWGLTAEIAAHVQDDPAQRGLLQGGDGG